MENLLKLADKSYRSRLIVGTGKYKDFRETQRAIEISGAEIVTVAVRRVNITDPNKENLLEYLDPKKYTILPNTAGCYTADDAVRTCRLAREAGVGNMVKLEVIGDEKTLFPDIPATLDAPPSCRWRRRSVPVLVFAIPITFGSFWSRQRFL